MSENSQDLRVGMRALDKGFIRPGDLQRAIVEHTRHLKQTGPAGPSFDFFLLSRGYLTPEHLAQVVADDAPKAAIAVAPAPKSERTPTTTRGWTLGKYSILRELGRGAMGEVVEAIDLTDGRRVAVKRPFSRRGSRPVTPQDEERFLREAKLLMSLPRHPNLVEVYESGRLDGQCYIAMEVVDGRSMSEWRRTATLRQEVEALLQVATGVDHAHRHGILHRDLKPSNIMIRPQGQAVVMDFGLAKAVGPNRDLSLTPGGVMVGSPGYMSPEQVRCLKTVDGRADVYSLGVMLYQALTNRKPFEGRTPLEVMMRMFQDPIRRPTEIMRGGVNPRLYQGLEDVCLRALQRYPEDRTPTVKAFADELRRATKAETDLGAA